MVGEGCGHGGSSAIVVPDVLREYRTQVPLIEDQHTVGEFGSEGAHEPFGETVHPWATKRNPDGTDAPMDVKQLTAAFRVEM